MDTILIFGGGRRRLDEGLKLAQGMPRSRVIVSARAKSEVLAKAREYGIAENRIRCVYTGLDTVGEICTTVGIVNSWGTRRLHLVSDHWHLPRIMTIADVVYFLTRVRPIAVPVYDTNKSEPRSLINGDRLRAILWRTTGRIVYSKEVQERRSRIEALERQ